MGYRPYSRIWRPDALMTSPISLFDIRTHLRDPDEAEDDLISSYCLAAVAMVEKSIQRLLTPRTAVLYLQGLPDGMTPIELPGGEVSSITSMTVDGTVVSGLTVLGDSPALLIPSDNWPAVVGSGYPVIITYVVGYQTVPFDLVQAIKLLCGEMYLHRSSAEDVAQSRVMIPAELLMAQHRIASVS